MASDANISIFDSTTAVIDDDENDDEFTCAEATQMINWLLKIVMLPLAIVIIIGMSFTVRRKHWRLSCCWGRPGIAYPVNFLDDFSRRWLFALCYIIITTNIVDLFDGEVPFDPLPTDPDFRSKFSWLSVFVKLINVLIICLVYYPLFACVSHRQYIACNVIGFIYAILLLGWIAIIIQECHEHHLTDMDWAENGVVWVPQLISLLIYLVCSVFDFVNNVRQCCHKQMTETSPEQGAVEYVLQVKVELSNYQLYVKQLLLRPRKKTSDSQVSKTFLTNLKKKVADFANRFKYENIKGFQYPGRLIYALVVSALIIITFVIILGIGVDPLFSELEPTVEELAQSLGGDFAEYIGNVADYWRILRVVFHLSITLSAVVQVGYMFFTLVTFKRRMLKLFRGDHSWHVAMNTTPAKLMISGMRYPGYQIAFFIYGFFFTLVIIFMILAFLSIFTFVTIRVRFRNWLTDKLILMWPTILVAFIINYIQVSLCKYVFLQERGAVMALNNRRLYHVASYILFIFNVIIGAIAALKRIVLSLVFGTVRLGLLDHVLIMRGFEKMDSGHMSYIFNSWSDHDNIVSSHMSYISMMMVDVAHNHPALRTFVELLRQNQRERETSEASGISKEARLRKIQIKNRWLKAVTMINNPQLIVDRIQRQCRQRAQQSQSADSPMIDVQASTEFMMRRLGNNKENESRDWMQGRDVRIETGKTTVV